MRSNADYEGVDMPKITAAAAALLLVFALVGCGDDATPAESQNDTATQRSQSDEETPEPPTAETPEALAEDEKDAEFLEIVRGELLPDTQIRNASDDQLIQAGHHACDEVKDGTPPEDIRVVEGEQPARSGYYMDTSAILFGAQHIYCPETIQPPS